VVIAAILLIGGPELVRELEDFRMLAFGALMVLIMIWRPSGLLAFREPTIRIHPPDRTNHRRRGRERLAEASE
jgi:branched-chain amino acid transport system permease protein